MGLIQTEGAKRTHACSTSVLHCPKDRDSVLNLFMSSQKAHSHLLFQTIQHQFNYFIVVTDCLKAQVPTQNFISDFQPGKLQAHLRETDCHHASLSSYWRTRDSSLSQRGFGIPNRARNSALPIVSLEGSMMSSRSPMAVALTDKMSSHCLR